MFYEYAVDPKCFANWDSFRPLKGQFGWKQGRLISKFPKEWVRIVVKLIAENSKNLTFKQRKSMEDELTKYSNSIFIRSDLKLDESKDWLNNAINFSKLFDAIITCENEINNDKILIASELTPEDSLWSATSTGIVACTPDDLCRCVQKLLLASSHILFIDPYFKPYKNKWLVTLKKFISVATEKRTPILEYHLKIEDNEYIKPENIRQKDFEEECNRHLRKLLPRGRKLILVRWKQIDHSGDKFHARYVLTEHGGVWFDVGLDSGGPGEFTNVARLDEKTWQHRWNSFQKNSNAYEYVDKVEVTG